MTAETEKEVMTLDDEETFGRFYKPVSPTARGAVVTALTEEEFSDLQADTPKYGSVCVNGAIYKLYWNRSC